MIFLQVCSRSIKTTKICPTLHGGPLDYPKVSPAAAAETCAAWDQCYWRLEDAIARRPPPASATTMSDEEVYEKLTGDSIRSVKTKSKEQPESVDEVNEEDFYSAVSESASKLILHYGGLTKKVLAAGDMQTTLRVYAGLALIRNKLWHYNEHLEVNGARRAFFDEGGITYDVRRGGRDNKGGCVNLVIKGGRPKVVTNCGHLL